MEILHHERIFNPNHTEWIVFLHGAGGSTRTWKHQVEHFSERYNILNLDLRDHGLSKGIQPEKETYSLDVITRDIFGVLDHHSIQKAHFITLSMGSFLMQKIMLQRPEVVDRVVLAGAVILGNWRIRLFTRIALALNALLTYRQTYTIFSKLIMPKKVHAKSREIYMQQAEKITETEYYKWMGLYHEFFSTLKAFKDWKVTAKTLLAMGEDDFVFHPSAQAFSEQQKNVSMVTLANSGHICNIDNPTDFNQEVMTFLKETKQPA